jgi:CheY-like chemotaxis protein
MNTILVIEDNEDVNLMLAEALSDAGYSIKSAYTGIEAINEIKK